MSYINTTEEYGRTVKSVDLARFARDFAAALGGKVLPSKSDITSDASRIQYVAYGDAEISVVTVWNSRDKVHLDIRDLDRKPINGGVPYGAQYKTPTIRVSVDRPLKALVADVKRRLIEPSQAPRAALHAYAQEKADGAEQLKCVAAKLRKLGFETRCQDGESYSGGLYHNADGKYLSGRFYTDGRVTLERLDLSEEQARAVFKALGVA